MTSSMMIFGCGLASESSVVWSVGEHVGAQAGDGLLVGLCAAHGIASSSAQATARAIARGGMRQITTENIGFGAALSNAVTWLLSAAALRGRRRTKGDGEVNGN